jgi:type II secretory pathway pseudopilin PulG
MPVKTRAGAQDGWTLIELLVVMLLTLIVLGATLGSFENFTNTSSRNMQLNDQQDRVRIALDQLIRQARNLANPTTGLAAATPTTIAKAGDFELVFQTTDPQKQWVRYCLDFANKPREQVWYQTSIATSLTPQQVSGTASSGNTTMTVGCPSNDPNWQRKTQLADFVTNQANAVSGNSATDRPLFNYYNAADQKLSATTPIVDSATTATIIRVGSQVFLKINPTKPPAESSLASAAFMRNQNQRPTASFTVSTSGSIFTFDAGPSFDPEGRTLHYDWYQAPTGTVVPTSAASLPDCTAAIPVFPATPQPGSDWSCLSTSVVFGHSFPPGGKDVFLRVTDPGGLQAMTNLPAGGGDCKLVGDPLRDHRDCGRTS